MEAARPPKTITELVQWMKERCYNFQGYSIGSNSIYEGLGLEETLAGYVWYYTERGQRTTLAFFTTEQAAVAHAHQQIAGDKWAASHFVGLTASQTEAQELAGRLGALGVAFWQDTIPSFYSLQRPAYRTFVAGCDIKRAEFLKQQYYHKP